MESQAQNRFSENGQPKEEHLTDLGNAKRLVKDHGPGLHHCHPWGKWIVWDGRRWEIDAIAAVESRAKRVIADLFSWAVRKVKDIANQLKESANEQIA